MSLAPADFNVSGVEFISATLLAGANFFHLPGVGTRQTLWTCANLFIVWLILPNTASVAVLALFLLSGYGVARVLQVRSSSWLLPGYLALLVASFAILKQYSVLNWVLPGTLLRIVQITGLSYMLFRQIHVLVDASQGQIENLTLWSYVNYQLDLFTILAGPIQRYQDFERQWRELEPTLADPHELLQNCGRLLFGVVKIALIAPFFYKGWNELQGTLLGGQVTGWKYLVEFPIVLYFYPIYLYCNFSGYCDIVIAAGRFFGMELPENFDRPWLARNVIEFWTRWHITLGFWIRDYLFLPLYKPLAERRPKEAPSLAWICYLLAFAVAGAWHGTTFNFLLYGLWQGIGISISKLYEGALLSRFGRKGLAEYMKSRPIRVAAIVANIHFQCVSMLIFSQNDVHNAWHLVRGLI